MRIFALLKSNEKMLSISEFIERKSRSFFSYAFLHPVDYGKDGSDEMKNAINLAIDF